MRAGTIEALFAQSAVVQKSLTSQLTELGFRVIKVAADGNCMYTAVGKGLEWWRADAARLRRAACDQLVRARGCCACCCCSARGTPVTEYAASHILPPACAVVSLPQAAHADVYIPFVRGHALSTKLAQARKPGVWGDHVTLQALVDTESLLVHVYQLVGGQVTMCVLAPRTGDAATGPIRCVWACGG